MSTDTEDSDDTPRGVEVRLVLTRMHALALAQFVKRVGWSEFRSCAVDDAEAYLVRASVDQLQQALADAGFAPR